MGAYHCGIDLYYMMKHENDTKSWFRLKESNVRLQYMESRRMCADYLLPVAVVQIYGDR